MEYRGSERVKKIASHVSHDNKTFVTSPPSLLSTSSSSNIDQNPIIDQGAPFSVSGLLSALRLAVLSGQASVELEPLQRVSFKHGFGPHNADSHPTFAQMHFLVQDFTGETGLLELPVCEGDSPALIGNDILMQCVLDNRNGTMTVPRDILQNSKPLKLSIYTGHDKRTRLAMCCLSQKKTNTLLSSATSSPLLLAKRIHVSTHLPGADIRRLVSATIAPKLLSAADESVIHSLSRACTVCQRIGDPLPHPKVSLRKPLRDWNTKVVADLFYLPDQVGKSPILHVRDSATGYSETAIIPSRDLEVLFSFFKTTWVHRHRSPHSVSADPEFLPMAPHLEAIGIGYLRAPARRHQTINKTQSSQALDVSASPY
jgi:hypothetical protein